MLCAVSVQAIGTAAAEASPTAQAPYVHTFVDCMVRSGGRDTFWFGYDIPAYRGPQFVPSRDGPSLGGTNVLTEVDEDGFVVQAPDSGLVEYFTDGSHHHAFAVTVPRHHQLKWTLITHEDMFPEGSTPRTSVALTDGAPLCPAGTPRGSAVVQSSHGIPIIVATPGASRLDHGLAVRSTVRFDVANVVSGCSDGGKPLAPLVLWGYDDALTMASVGVVEAVPHDGFRQLPSRRVVRMDTFGSDATYVRTFVATREVLEPQKAWTDPFLGVTLRGVAATMVLADVYGRCRFGDRVVVSTEPMWVHTSGFPALVVSVTDGATQQSSPVDCSFGASGCPVSVTPGPGGSRWR